MSHDGKPGDDQRIVAAREFALSPSRIALTEAERERIRDTFLRLDAVVQSEGVPWEEALLLLTTCRNSVYALDAMYAEAVKWCAETEGTNGFAIALDRLNAAVAGEVSIEKAAARAGSALHVAANFLNEMEKKYRLYFERFEETRNELLKYAARIADPVARKQFTLKFVDVGSGPGPDEDRLLPPDGRATEPYRERLLEWFAVARPLTSLARTYISSVLGVGPAHPGGRDCAYYVRQMKDALVYWEARGLRCPALPPEAVFERPPEGSREFSGVQRDRLRGFVAFCAGVQKAARLFVAEKLPGEKGSAGVGFRLKRVPADCTIDVGGRRFEIRRDMFVIIADMRNSTGDPCWAPELKVMVEGVIRHLRNEGMARSQTVHDDCRVIATETLDDAVSCMRRLHDALEPMKKPGGFDGMRIGLTRGEMLFDLDGPEAWERVLKGARAPLDSAENTIARAARLMALDKRRWDSSGSDRTLVDALGDWAADPSLVFFDERIRAALGEADVRAARSAGVLDLKGVGRTQCWVLPVCLFGHSLRHHDGEHQGQVPPGEDSLTRPGRV